MAETVDVPVPERRGLWVWWVCALLLLASTINYMDRQTLSATADRIKLEFHLSNEQYGNLEWAFGWAFAAGAFCFGFIADRANIRWLYPAVLLAWSIMGFCTGWVETYLGLLLCRLFLGLFEAGHWPCALKTTQRLLPPHRRTLGNSVLQSGTAIGAIVTPQIIKVMLATDPESWRPLLQSNRLENLMPFVESLHGWRPAFQAIGLVGIGWVAMWLLTIRGRELAPEPAAASADATGDAAHERSFWSIVLTRRFFTLFVVVILINTCYHFFRAWLKLFLVEGREYSEEAALDIMTWFYVANDIGCLSAGFATMLLHRMGWRVHASRLLVFGTCGLLTSLSLLLPSLPAGPGLLAVLMILSAGSLGLFPCYYSFTQDLTTRHQGKVTGLLGTSAWLVTSPMHKMFGKWIDETGRHDWGLALAGMLPLLGLMMLMAAWGRDERPSVASD